jgi:hypothetical protein
MKISRFAKSYVARKLEYLQDAAARGCGLHYELYAQRFTEMVDALTATVRSEALRQYIVEQARKTGDYCDEAGEWALDAEGELIFRE